MFCITVGKEHTRGAVFSKKWKSGDEIPEHLYIFYGLGT